VALAGGRIVVVAAMVVAGGSGAPDGLATRWRRAARLRRRRERADARRPDHRDGGDGRRQSAQPLQGEIAVGDLVVREPPPRGHATTFDAEGRRRLSRA
jgi:hypothetical protein